MRLKLYLSMSWQIFTNLPKMPGILPFFFCCMRASRTFPRLRLEERELLASSTFCLISLTTSLVSLSTFISCPSSSSSCRQEERIEKYKCCSKTIDVEYGWKYRCFSTSTMLMLVFVLPFWAPVLPGVLWLPGLWWRHGALAACRRSSEVSAWPCWAASQLCCGG